MSRSMSQPMDRMAFARARAQALEAIREDTDLTSTAKVVGCYVAEKYLSPSSLVAWPSNSTIGNAIGTTAKTVQRAFRALGLAGHIRIEARNGRTNLIVFPVIEAAALPGADSNSDRGELCPGGETPVSRGPGHDCPPNLTKEPHKEPRQSSGLSFPRYAVPIGSDEAACWEKALRRQGIASLESYDLTDEEDGVAVFILPARWPPADDDEFAWRRVKIYFEDRIRRPQPKPIAGECTSCE